MFSTLVSGLGLCIQPHYYRTLMAIEKVSYSRSGPQQFNLQDLNSSYLRNS